MDHNDDIAHTEIRPDHNDDIAHTEIRPDHYTIGGGPGRRGMRSRKGRAAKAKRATAKAKRATAKAKKATAKAKRATAKAKRATKGAKRAATAKAKRERNAKKRKEMARKRMDKSRKSAASMLSQERGPRLSKSDKKPGDAKSGKPGDASGKPGIERETNSVKAFKDMFNPDFEKAILGKIKQGGEKRERKLCTHTFEPEKQAVLNGVRHVNNRCWNIINQIGWHKHMTENKRISDYIRKNGWTRMEIAGRDNENTKPFGTKYI